MRFKQHYILNSDTENPFVCCPALLSPAVPFLPELWVPWRQNLTYALRLSLAVAEQHPATLMPRSGTEIIPLLKSTGRLQPVRRCRLCTLSIFLLGQEASWQGQPRPAPPDRLATATRGAAGRLMRSQCYQLPVNFSPCFPSRSVFWLYCFHHVSLLLPTKVGMHNL